MPSNVDFVVFRCRDIPILSSSIPNTCLLCLSLPPSFYKMDYSLTFHFPFPLKFGFYTGRGSEKEEGKQLMADWGPVLVALLLFVLLTPGLLFQLPGNNRAVDFCNMQTSGVSIFVHTIIYFGLVTIFLIAIGVHIYFG